MRSKTLSVIGLFIISCLNSHAIPSFPRDLKCTTRSGVEITLNSNNSLWSQSQGGRYKVTLDVGSELGMETTWVNNRAMHTRGNDTGIREYIFTSSTNDTFFVTLEFHAPFGLATEIKTFRVRSNEIQFDHSQRSLRGDVCKVTFYERIEL